MKDPQDSEGQMHLNLGSAAAAPRGLSGFSMLAFRVQPPRGGDDHHIAVPDAGSSGGLWSGAQPTGPEEEEEDPRAERSRKHSKQAAFVTAPFTNQFGALRAAPTSQKHRADALAAMRRTPAMLQALRSVAMENIVTQRPRTSPAYARPSGVRAGTLRGSSAVSGGETNDSDGGGLRESHRLSDASFSRIDRDCDAPVLLGSPMVMRRHPSPDKAVVAIVSADERPGGDDSTQSGLRQKHRRHTMAQQPASARNAPDFGFGKRKLPDVSPSRLTETSLSARGHQQHGLFQNVAHEAAELFPAQGVSVRRQSLRQAERQVNTVTGEDASAQLRHLLPMNGDAVYIPALLRRWHGREQQLIENLRSTVIAQRSLAGSITSQTSISCLSYQSLEKLAAPKTVRTQAATVRTVPRMFPAPPKRPSTGPSHAYRRH